MSAKFTSIDEYIASVAPDARPILKKLRSTVKAAVPKAAETISYQIPAFKLDRVFLYFAAFKKHIGIYPPLKQDKVLVNTLKPYRGDKGNLQFPLHQPMPYQLISRIAKALAQEYAGKPLKSAAVVKRGAGKNDMRKIEIENVNHPGHVERVDAGMYKAMKHAYLAVLPAAEPGLTVAEIHRRLIARLPQDLYPQGAKSGWWAKAVQLDLEAKGVIKRVKISPLRLYRT